MELSKRLYEILRVREGEMYLFEDEDMNSSWLLAVEPMRSLIVLLQVELMELINFDCVS